MPELRLKACVDRWPEAEEGAYDPRCCRFPKSCSATVYDKELAQENDLEVVDVESTVHKDWKGTILKIVKTAEIITDAEFTTADSLLRVAKAINRSGAPYHARLERIPMPVEPGLAKPQVKWRATWEVDLNAGDSRL